MDAGTEPPRHGFQLLDRPVASPLLVLGERRQLEFAQFVGERFGWKIQLPPHLRFVDQCLHVDIHVACATVHLGNTWPNTVNGELWVVWVNVSRCNIWSAATALVGTGKPVHRQDQRVDVRPPPVSPSARLVRTTRPKTPARSAVMLVCSSSSSFVISVELIRAIVDLALNDALALGNRLAFAQCRSLRPDTAQAGDDGARVA